MSVIHWDSRDAWGLMPPRAVQLWCIYAAMVNREGVAWPSLSHLRKALRLKDKGAALEARRWLVQHDALELVRGYVPPSERGKPATEHERRMFVRLTGTVTIEGVTYRLTYAPGEEAGADVWRSGNDATLVGKNLLPQSEISHQPQSEISHPNVVKDEGGEKNVTPTPVEETLTERQRIIRTLARWNEAKTGNLPNGYARGDMDAIADDYTIAQVEQAILSVGERKPQRPLQYLRSVLATNALKPAAAPLAPAAGFWGRDLTHGE